VLEDPERGSRPQRATLEGVFGLLFRGNKTLGGLDASSQSRNRRLQFLLGEPVRYGAADDAPDTGY
jgi:hypothetical protein